MRISQSSLWLLLKFKWPNFSMTQKKHNDYAHSKCQCPCCFAHSSGQIHECIPDLLMGASFWVGYSCSHSLTCPYRPPHFKIRPSESSPWTHSCCLVVPYENGMRLKSNNKKTCLGSWGKQPASLILRWDLIAQPTVYSRSMKVHED